MAALLLLAAAVFVLGINWGLPSRDADSYFFGSTGAAAAGDSTTSFRLSGAGIDHLVGGWDDDPNRPADVAAHPIIDRDHPVTLIANDHGLSARQIADRGDAALVKLLADENSAWGAMTKLAAATDHNPDDVEAAQARFNLCHLRVQQYVEHYNNQATPDLAESIQRDNVNRARILIRYRLYTDQPDEMITFRALSKIHPSQRQFDPRMYQYGGLWIYPVGGLLRLAGLLNLATITNDRSFYLDNPAAFGRFYIIARAYSAAWGLVAVAAVFALMRRITGGVLLPSIAALCFIAMPVTIDLAHEAKPHLAGVALLLLATLAASNYVRTGQARWIVWTAIACGAAVGMVLWAIVGLALIPLMLCIQWRRPGRMFGLMVLMLLIAAAVYFVTNPYVGSHLLHSDQREVLKSNLSNTSAMYHASAMSGHRNAVRLIIAGTSWPLGLAGAGGLIVVLLVHRRDNEPLLSAHIGWFLGGLALLMWVQFAALAAGKPGEYGRFAALIDAALMLAAVAAVGRLLAQPAARSVAGAILVAATAMYSFSYERGFLADTTDPNSRLRAAATLAQIATQMAVVQGHPMLWVPSEPAPYCLPPVDLFRWKIVLLTADSFPVGRGVLVAPLDTLDIWNPATTPISWADKRFDILVTGR